MRPIKFRGKCLKAGQWFYGYLHCVEDRAFLYAPEMIEVDPDTVGQFTGCVDKNGVFSSGCFCCGWGSGSSTAMHPYMLDDKRIEVVGNVYDTPELLR